MTEEEGLVITSTHVHQGSNCVVQLTRKTTSSLAAQALHSWWQEEGHIKSSKTGRGAVSQDLNPSASPVCMCEGARHGGVRGGSPDPACPVPGTCTRKTNSYKVCLWTSLVLNPRSFENQGGLSLGELEGCGKPSFHSWRAGMLCGLVWNPAQKQQFESAWIICEGDLLTLDHACTEGSGICRSFLSGRAGAITLALSQPSWPDARRNWSDMPSTAPALLVPLQLTLCSHPSQPVCPGRHTTTAGGQPQSELAPAHSDHPPSSPSDQPHPVLLQSIACLGTGRESQPPADLQQMRQE